MKLLRTVGLAVAVSLIAGAVAALAQIRGTAAPADPTANAVDAAGRLRVPADYRTLYQAPGVCRDTPDPSRSGGGFGPWPPTADRARRKCTPSTPPGERSTRTGSRAT